MSRIRPKQASIHIGLFVLTFIATTLAGIEWTKGIMVFFDENGFRSPAWLTQQDINAGLQFSVPFLLFLTCHEFGHYFTARWHKVKVSLPYYIPLYLGFTSSIGTMGALIRIKQFSQTKKQYFDIGIAGPLAGFVIAIGVLFYGFTHLPPQEQIFEIHPTYEQYGLDYADHVYAETEGMNLAVGDNLLMLFFKKYVASDPSRIPNPHEMMHNPYLFSGFLALFFTALNLLPIGQLDGGHIVFGLFGKRKHSIISPALFVLFVFYAGLGVVSPYDGVDGLLSWGPLYLGFLYLTFSRIFIDKKNVLLLAVGVLAVQMGFSAIWPAIHGYTGWLVFSLLIGRVLGVHHPPSVDVATELSPGRKVLGWLAIIIFLLCFSPQPLIIS